MYHCSKKKTWWLSIILHQILSNNFKKHKSYSTLKVILRIPSKNCIFWYTKLIQLFSIFAQALRSDMLKFGRISQIFNRRYLDAQEIFFWSVKSSWKLIFFSTRFQVFRAIDETSKNGMFCLIPVPLWLRGTSSSGPRTPRIV